MAHAFVIQDAKQLVRRLETLTEDPETSVAVVFMSSTPAQEELPVLKDAAKLCDRVIVVIDGGTLPSGTERLLGELGVDIVFHPSKINRVCRVDAMVNGVDATLILQALTLTLPNVVVIGRHDVQRVRAVKNILQTFGDITALREI